MNGKSIDQQISQGEVSNGKVLPDHMNKGQFIKIKTKMMKKTIFVFAMVFIACTTILLTGCKKENSIENTDSQNVYSDQLLRFSKTIRVYDSEGKYWMDFEISSNAKEGIDNTLLLKPTFEVLNTTYEELQKDAQLLNVNSQIKYDRDQDLNIGSLQVVVKISNTNIPSTIPYKTKFGIKNEELEKLAIFNQKSSYTTYTWQNPTHRGVQTTVVGPYQIPITYYNRSGIGGTWRNCGTITHYGPNYSYSFVAFATANPAYATSNVGVKFSAYTTYSGSLNIGSPIWLFPLGSN